MCFASQPVPVCKAFYHHLIDWVCKGTAFIRNMQRLAYFMIETLKIDCVKIVTDRKEMPYLLCFMTEYNAWRCIVFVLFSGVCLFGWRDVYWYSIEEWC